MTAFLLSLAAVGGALFAATAPGWFASRALFPPGREFLVERIGWSFALGCILLVVVPPVVFLLGASPGWIPFLLGGILMIAAARFLPPSPGLPSEASAKEGERRTEAAANTASPSALSALLFALLLVGVLLYLLRALTEPMWSNDFLAIWGFKGKTIFFSHGVPSRLFTWQPLAFSRPEYPLGLPFLYASLASLSGGWDDHAMALLFPVFQCATLGVLFGWLRRRGIARPVALAAAALVALYEPLYSAFHTGLAEVPLAFGFLLFGTALADSLDSSSTGAFRRLALASLWIASLKNEGLYVAVAGFSIALLSRRSGRWRAAAAALGPALAVYLLHVAWRGRLPLSAFDLGLFSLPRLAEGLDAAARLPGLTGWLGLAAVDVLILVGRKEPAGDRMLLLAGLALAAYLVLPSVALGGPAWLVQTSLLRTASALVPLLAAAIGPRLAPSARPAAEASAGPG